MRMPQLPALPRTALCLAVLLPLHGAAATPPKPAAPAAVPVAGFTPDRRPVGAPVITSAPASDALTAQRLHGVAPPWPGNLKQVAQQQGNWYSPLFHPGMTSPYDLRDWHVPAGTR